MGTTRAALALAAAAAMLAACAPMRYQVVAGPPEEDDVILVPPRVRTAAAVPGAYLVAYPGARPGPGCELDAGSFRLHTEANVLLFAPRASFHDDLDESLAAPTVPAVSLQPGAIIEHESVLSPGGGVSEQLSHGLDRLVTAGCLPLRSRLDPLTRALEAAPLPSGDLARLTNGRPMRDESIPLRPGEELRVTTPLLDAQGQWHGATTLWYPLRRRKDGQIVLVPPAAAALTAVRDGLRLHAQALDLPAVPVARYWQMMIFARQNDFTQVNLLVAAPDPATLEAAAALVRSEANGCARGGRPGLVRRAPVRHRGQRPDRGTGARTLAGPAPGHD